MNVNGSWISRISGRLEPKRILAVLILPALTLLAGMYLGKRAAYEGLNAGPQTVPGMRVEISRLREELKVALGDLQMQRTLREVDSRALEMVRAEMVAQKERTAELEEDLRFFRSLVAPEDMANGISLRQPELVSGEVPGHFNFRIVIQQKARKHKMVEGTLSVSVYGDQGGEEVSYPLAALSQSMAEQVVPLQFLYFQAIEGDLVLPEGFEPEGIAAVASASKPDEASISEQFPWELQERFTNVGR